MRKWHSACAPTNYCQVGFGMRSSYSRLSMKAGNLFQKLLSSEYESRKPLSKLFEPSNIVEASLCKTQVKELREMIPHPTANSGSNGAPLALPPPPAPSAARFFHYWARDGLGSIVYRSTFCGLISDVVSLGLEFQGDGKPRLNFSVRRTKLIPFKINWPGLF